MDIDKKKRIEELFVIINNEFKEIDIKLIVINEYLGKIKPAK